MLIAYRDRAILKFYLYSAARIGTGCRLKVSDFKQQDEEATIRLKRKGKKIDVVGLHYAAAEAISQYLEAAEIASGPLFRARLNSRSQKLGKGGMSTTSMWRCIEGYLRQLPHSRKAVPDENGDPLLDPEGNQIKRCIYTPHSLRATTATLLLKAGVDITKVQELLGHRHVTTTQVYDKRRRKTSEGASHDVPL